VRVWAEPQRPAREQELRREVAPRARARPVAWRLPEVSTVAGEGREVAEPSETRSRRVRLSWLARCRLARYHTCRGLPTIDLPRAHDYDVLLAGK